MTDTQEILIVERLAKSFGGNQAVRDCSFGIDAGSITGLIGPNGAGKSTAFNLISGLVRPDKGRVIFDGHDVAGVPVHRIARLGLARTFQVPRELKALTVLENLMVVPDAQTGERLLSLLSFGRRVAREEEVIRERALNVLRYVELDRHARKPAGSLSGGQKKLLELARCLMGIPRMILLDEPTAGVNPRLIGEVVTVLQRVHADGITLAVIEHNMNVVMELCERVIVLVGGRMLVAGTPEEVRSDRRVLEAYLGAGNAGHG